jgi:hypothetical protein
MINECGAVGRMRIDGGKESTWREPELVPLCPQIPDDLAWDRTLASTVLSGVFPKIETMHECCCSETKVVAIPAHIALTET